ncbi:MAG: anti-sigma factor family protein, partial [Nitrospirota bacterium]
MKKECDYTRRMLPRYLKGNLFLPQQKRVERHLAACAVCRSQSDALRRISETREFLQYLAPEEGLAGRVKAGASLLVRARTLFFRPLWLAAIVIAIVVVNAYVIMPLLHDPDLEKLDAGPAVPPAAAVKSEPVTAPTPTPPP